MTKYIIKNLGDIKDLLQGLTAEQYSKKIEILSEASIGQHVRHILEFFQSLFLGSITGEVDYDSRKRDLNLENDLRFAISVTDEIIDKLLELKEDRSLTLIANYSTDTDVKEKIKTTLFRELAYNLEHSIHHQALIKVAVFEMQLTGTIKANFGYAPSTIRFNNNNNNVHSNIHSN